MKNYQCECGHITGVACEWQGPINEMVVIEWMPECIRASHEAAGNRGCYPHNGAVRVAVESSCADVIVESDPEWSEIIEAPVEKYATQIANKDDVSNWETVTTYGSTFPDGDGEGACDVEVQIGDDDGIWFLRTRDDAGGSDNADETQYATEAEARAAAEKFAEDHDECDGKSAEQYLTDELEERASEGEDAEGEFALYWETSLEDAGERTRYSTHAAAVAAAELAQAGFDAANPASGGVTYLCGFSVRRLVDGEWVSVDENGEVAE